MRLGYEICIQSTCFPGRSGLWISEEELKLGGWDKATSRGSRVRKGRSVGSTRNRVGRGYNRHSDTEMRIRLGNWSWGNRGRAEYSQPI